MKRVFFFASLTLAVLFSFSVLAADKPLSDAKKKSLKEILTKMKLKAPVKKEGKHKVSLPVASAGARAKEVKADTKFSILWPGSDISPLAALANALKYRADQGKDLEGMQKTVDEFAKTFPEYKSDPLLKDLRTLLKSAK